MCYCVGRCDLFSNSGDVNKDGYSNRCSENDNNGGGEAANIFVTLAMFAIASIFAEQKEVMAKYE